eukprot:2417211-Rhodomonas_salina.2
MRKERRAGCGLMGIGARGGRGWEERRESKGETGWERGKRGEEDEEDEGEERGERRGQTRSDDKENHGEEEEHHLQGRRDRPQDGVHDPALTPQSALRTDPAD